VSSRSWNRDLSFLNMFNAVYLQDVHSQSFFFLYTFHNLVQGSEIL